MNNPLGGGVLLELDLRFIDPPCNHVSHRRSYDPRCGLLLSSKVWILSKTLPCELLRLHKWIYKNGFNHISLTAFKMTQFLFSQILFSPHVCYHQVSPRSSELAIWRPPSPCWRHCTERRANRAHPSARRHTPSSRPVSRTEHSEATRGRQRAASKWPAVAPPQTQNTHVPVLSSDWWWLAQQPVSLR